MLNDLANWLPLMLTITVGFAFGFNLLAPNYSLEGGDGPLFPNAALALDLSVGGPFMASFWALVRSAPNTTPGPTRTRPAPLTPESNTTVHPRPMPNPSR